MSEQLNPDKMTGTDLAYLGDAVMELMTREKLLATGVTDVGRLNKLALSYVRATAQSEAVERVLPLLTDEEAEVFKRGRNAHGISAPKSASTADYRRATGLEALFAYLWLRGEDDRRRELFAAAYPEKPEET